MIVLDASVALKWFIREPETTESVRILDGLAMGREQAAVPELFYYEIFAVLARKHADFTLWAREGVPWLMNLPLRRFPLLPAHAPVMQEFTARGLTGYDAAYAALALTNDWIWLTYDTRARMTLDNPAWIVRPDEYLARKEWPI